MPTVRSHCDDERITAFGMLLEAHAAITSVVNRELEATAAHFRQVNDGLMQSLSWRVTKPLRAAKGAREG